MLLRPLGDGDRDRLRVVIETAWGFPIVTPVGVYHTPHSFDGFVTELDRRWAGAVTYRVDGRRDEVEVVTLNAVEPGRGVGRALLDAVRGRAAEIGAVRVWLITTTDNEHALGFYDHIGMRRGRLWPRFDQTVRAAKPGLAATVVFDAVEFEWTRGRRERNPDRVDRV